jgi:phage tail sheath protein FI
VADSLLTVAMVLCLSNSLERRSETNPPEDIEAGQVTVEVGIAPVKPAEFVVFRLSQFTGGGGEAEVAE